MSARNEDNSRFAGEGLGALRDRLTGERLLAEDAYRRVLDAGDHGLVRSLVAESRGTWIDSYRKLLEVIDVPVVLLWFSVREPAYTETYNSVDGLFGAFPHLVSEEMVQAVSAECSGYVACVSDRGRPQQLISRFTGRPAPIVIPGANPRDMVANLYYPTPEMHQEHVSAAGTGVRELLGRRPRRDRSGVGRKPAVRQVAEGTE